MIMKTMKPVTWGRFKKLFPQLDGCQVERGAFEAVTGQVIDELTIPPGIYSPESLTVWLADRLDARNKVKVFEGIITDTRTYKILIRQKGDT